MTISWLPAYVVLWIAATCWVLVYARHCTRGLVAEVRRWLHRRRHDAA